MNQKRQIFAVGGKFFREPWEKPLLQKHLLSLVDREFPKVCFIGAAGGDNPSNVEQFYREMSRHDCRLAHFNAFWPLTNDLVSYFLDFDILYVGGGSTRNLVSIARDIGMDNAFRIAWENGIVLAGTSAGAICWFEGCITDSFPLQLLPLRCFGFLKGSHSTHFDARPDRPTEFQNYLNRGDIPYPGLATDDDVAVHYIGEEINEVVSQRKGAKASIYESRADGSIRTELPGVRLLLE